MLTDLTEDLAAAGWRVTVITSRSAYEAGAIRLGSEEFRKDIRILRVRGSSFGRHGTIGRLVDYTTYMVGAARRLAALPKPDAVVAMSDPPLVIGLAVADGMIRGSATVYWVQDLFPQVAAQLKAISPRGIVYRLVAGIARWLHRRCDLVIALGPRMARAMIEADAQPKRTLFLHNWVDCTAVEPMPIGRSKLGARIGTDDRFVVMYSGNAGRAHTFDALIEAARRLRGEAQIQFLFIGGGKQMPELKRIVAAENLANVSFRDYVSRNELGASLSAASVSVVTESPAVTGSLVPSKTYGILASGRPLIFIGPRDSDVAQIVHDAGCGFVISPSDPAGVVNAIQSLRDDPRLAAEMGVRGRKAAVEKYERRTQTGRWAACVSRTIGPATGGEPLAALPSAFSTVD